MTAARQLRFWAVALVATLLLLWLLRGILLPFVAGMAVAYFLDPVADRLERTGGSRQAATALITIAFLGIVILTALLLIPQIEAQVVAFAQRVPGYVQGVVARSAPVIEQVEHYLSPADAARLRAGLGELAGKSLAFVGTVLTSLLSGGMALFNVLSLLFITPVVTFYLLRDWDKLLARVRSWLPRRHAPVIVAQFREIDRTLAGFVRGQATVCLVLAAYYAIGWTAVGLDLGLVVGLYAGFVAFIPYLGAISGSLMALGLAFAQSPDWALPGLVVAVFAVGQVLEGNFLVPKLVGDRVGLHPVWVIFALLAGGAVFGFLGLLIAVPVAAVVGVLARFALSRYLDSPLYHGGEDEPSEAPARDEVEP